VGLILTGLAGLVVHGLLYVLTRRRRPPRKAPVRDSGALLLPLALCWWHVLNGTTVLLLLATGFGLRFFAAGAAWGQMVRMLHGGAGLLLTLTWLFWLLFSALRRRALCRDETLRCPDPFRGIKRQLVYYAWGVFCGRADPHVRTARDPLNPLQKVVYLLVMGALMPLIMATGLALLPMFRTIAGGWRAALLDGHTIAGCLLLLFLCVHLYLTAWGPGGRMRFGSGRGEDGG
jgi:thiosulfate reductase cytochrome b subunit